VESETIRFEANDGTQLVGDLIVPKRPRAATIVCHPHPQFGGNRFNPVVDALFIALTAAGVATLRFDFRADFDDGHGERLDAEAALAELRERAPGVPTFAAGYSFGAMIALALDDSSLRGKILIAPPLGRTTALPKIVEETACLVMIPAHDQFAPPGVAEPIVDDWPNADFEVVESVDHFMTGGAATAASRALAWIERRLTPPTDPATSSD